MSDHISSIEYKMALDDFKRERSKARLQHLWAALTGKSEELLHYDEITKNLHTSGSSSKGIKEIPINAIVGSVNRYQDFDKNFLPLRDDDMERWARVKSMMTSPGSPGLPPIHAYKIGDSYFVLDGNHRVSVARQMEIDKIEAHVTEIQTRVPLSPDDTPDDIILKQEYVDFLEKTQFDKVVPDANLLLTFPGQYETLKEHIRVHRHYMGNEQQREIPMQEATRHWFDLVYSPIIDIIREQEILQEFPERTETDLYIWLLDHQSYMEKELGWSVRPEKAATDFVNRRGKSILRMLDRIGRLLMTVLLPKPLEDFSSPGEWRLQKEKGGQELFSDILVAMSGQSESWIALEQAIIIAQLEKADIRGLIVNDQSYAKTINENDITEAFRERLDQAAIGGNLVFSEGHVAETICERAKVNDLVILKLSYPPSSNFFSRLSSGMRMILRQSSRPVLVVKDQICTMNHILLAYDGSPKGKEALFVASYLARKHGRKISVLAVEDDEKKGQRLLRDAEEVVGEYYSKIQFYQYPGSTSDVILQVANELSVDLILMGGYGLPPVLEILFGSTLDAVLRRTRVPVFVCK